MNPSFRLMGLACGTILSLAVGRPAFAQLPGYEIVRVTDDTNFNAYVDINDCGQIVFSKRLGEDWTQFELFVYSDGGTHRITFDEQGDISGRINDRGVVTWATGQHGETQAMILESGNIRVAYEQPLGVSAPNLNNLGDFVVSDWIGSGCEESDADILLLTGSDWQRLTSGGFSNQNADITDTRSMVWTRYDFCQKTFWDAHIVLFSDGRQQVLPRFGQEAQLPSLNSRLQIVWDSIGQNSERYVEVWESGETWILSDNGAAPVINDAGNIAFVSDMQVYLYHDGVIERMTSGIRSGGPRINNDNEIAMLRG